MAVRTLAPLVAIAFVACSSRGAPTAGNPARVNASYQGKADAATGCIEPSLDTLGVCVARDDGVVKEGGVMTAIATFLANPGWAELEMAVTAEAGPDERVEVSITLEKAFPLVAADGGSADFDLAEAVCTLPYQYTNKIYFTYTTPTAPYECGRAGPADSRHQICTSVAHVGCATSGVLHCRREGDAYGCSFAGVRFADGGMPGVYEGWAHAKYYPPPADPATPPACPWINEYAPAPGPKSLVGVWGFRTWQTPQDDHCLRPGGEAMALSFHDDGTVDVAYCGRNNDGVGYAVEQFWCEVPLTRASGTYVYDGKTVTLSVPGADWFKPATVMTTPTGIAFEFLYQGSDVTGFVPLSAMP